MPVADEPRLIHVERLMAAIDLPIGRWDRDVRLVFCNDHYIAWAARGRDELLGRTLEQLFGARAWASASPAFAQAFEGRTVTYERQLAHGPTAGRWARIQVFPDADASGRIEAVFTIATDIHDDVMLRESLTATKRRLDRFTENIPYPLTYVDRDCTIRFVNKAYVEAVGKSAGDLLGRHIGMVRGARRWAEHEPYFRRALQGEPVLYTRLVRSLPQGPRWMRTSYVPDRDEHGDVVGLYTVTIDVHELTVAQEKLKRRVERDALTDVLSRRTLMDRIEATLADESHPPHALYFVDLDGFKDVNDRLGHREGDALLIAVGRALKAALRTDDAVGRFGGDEFLVFAPIHDASSAHALAHHLLDAVRTVAEQHGSLAGRVGASIGYALAPTDSRHPLKLLQLADDAMYLAKREGKDRAVHCAALAYDAQR